MAFWRRRKRRVVAKHKPRVRKQKEFVGIRAKRNRVRMVWNDRLEQLTEREFSQRYRLTKAMFTNLAELIRNMVESTRSMAGRSKPIAVELQLSMALRFLAGGSVYDIIDLHGSDIPHFIDACGELLLQLMLHFR